MSGAVSENSSSLGLGSQVLDPLSSILGDTNPPLEWVDFSLPPKQTEPDFYGSLLGSKFTDPVEVLYLEADGDGKFDLINNIVTFKGTAEFGVSKLSGEGNVSCICR